MMLRRLALAILLALAPAFAFAQQDAPRAHIAPTAVSTDNGDRIATTAWVNLWAASAMPLATGKIWIGSAGGIATPQTPSGDCTISAAGVVTCTQSAGAFLVNGTLTVAGTIIDSTNGIVMNNPTGGSKGAGTINIAADYYKNGTIIAETVSAPLALSAGGNVSCPTCVLISGTAQGDTNYSILSTDRYVYTNAAFTAPRTWTLPAANSLTAGTTIWVQDARGTVTSTNTLTVSRAGADTIDLANTTLVITGAGGGITFTTDGVSNWGTPIQTVSTGGTGRQTLTNHGVLIGAATNPITQLAVGSNGQLLLGATGADPAFGTMSQDCTITAAGVITCTGINGVSQTTAWTTYTPTPSCGTGTFTSASATGRYKQIGKTVFVQAALTVTTNGTCAGNMRMSLPLTSNGNAYALSMFDNISASTGSAVASTDATTIRMFTVAGAYPTGFNPIVTGVYEIP